jgi:hypothetical protein
VGDAVNISWSPLEGAFATSVSRATCIDTFWRMVPVEERTPARRKLIIALVDHIREYRETTGKLSPNSDPAEAERLIERVVVGDAL